MRHFTANEPIREPADLDGLRMRFPNSPQFLMNAEALGAEATEVAYEELFLALQQGTVDGQENPITNIAASSLQRGPGLHQPVRAPGELQPGDHRRGLGRALDRAAGGPAGRGRQRPSSRCPGCVDEDEETTLAEWGETGDIEVVEDVDVEAFRTQVDTYLRENFNEEQLAVYEAIRGAAE